MIYVQKLLQDGMTLQELEEKYGIENFIPQDKEYVCLNYSQLKSDPKDKVASQCRGLTLRLDKHYTTLSYPMDRFLNFGQPGAAQINLKKATCWEKLDGTLIIVSFNIIQNSWMIGTRGRPRGDVPIDGYDFTFSMLFEIGMKKCFGIDNFQRWANENLDFNCTYCFELCSPYNRIVVQYPDFLIRLISIRSLTNLNELNIIPISEKIKIPTPKTYPIDEDSFQLIQNMVQSWSAKEHEGVVISYWDENDNIQRIKLKNEGYLQHNKDRDAASSLKNCLRFILQEKDDDFVAGLPELIQERFLDLKKDYLEFYSNLEKDWNVVKDISDMKQFALIIKRFCKYTDPLFSLKRSKISSLKEYFKEVSENDSKLKNLLKLIRPNLIEVDDESEN